MFWNRKRHTIHVELFDADSGKRFAASDLPPDKLPASFEADTTLHLGDQDWQVVRADPMTAAEFTRTGKLHLLLRRADPVQLIDPAEVLFSLPTIANPIPAVTPGSTKLGKNVLELQEDDWRQVELISTSLAADISEELAAIRAIYEHHRRGPGFDQIHVRKRIANPLPNSSMTTNDVTTALGGPDATRQDGIAYVGVAGVIQDAFAIHSLSSIYAYGLSDPTTGIVDVLCLSNLRANNLGPAGHASTLAALAREHDLYLVDWRRATAFDPDEFDACFAAHNAPPDQTPASE